MREGTGSQLRVAARNLEQASPDVAIILHQEQLDRVPTSGAAQPMPAVARVWGMFYELRPCLAAARARAYKRHVPTAVEAAGLTAAVVQGKLTMKLLCGSATTDPGAQLRALARVWPCLMEMVREFHPRDESSAEALLCMAHEAFDIGAAAPARAVPVVVTAVIEEMARRFEVYLRGNGEAPTWTAVREAAATESARVAAITGVLADTGHRETQAERKARLAAAAAANPTPPGAPQPPPTAPTAPGPPGSPAKTGGPKPTP